MIYLDNNATTCVAPEVVQAMQPYWCREYGNASSLHQLGQAARHGVEVARAQLAQLVGAKPQEIVFTSGGTEADNLAIRGTLAVYPAKRHLVTTAVEHPAVHDLCRQLAAEGYRVTTVGVDGCGRLDLDAFAAALDDDTALATVMLANNETGVILDVASAAELCAARGIPLLVDAVQALGKIPVEVKTLGAPLVSFSAHKLHGPKGVGALYVGRGARLRSLLVGGPQERELRPGTENVPAIVGFGQAAELARIHLSEKAGAIAALRDYFEQRVLERVPIARVIGDPIQRLPNTSKIGFEALQSEAILVALSEEGVCASAGSACASGSLEPSRILRAMAIAPRLAHGAIRFSLSRYTAVEELEQALGILTRVITRLAALQSSK